MKNTSVIISTYTADVSGVCSALYELGGMVVIHDPSGCNSTYNTHDEPRWYDQDSLVFISGLSEIDAIMGSDDKLIEDIVCAAKELKPEFIALVRTPVPMMTGVDFEAIRLIIEAETNIPTYYFPANGMHSYIQGVNMALAAVAENMVVPNVRKNNPGKPEDARHINNIADREGITFSGRKVNLLGVTPLDFSVNETLHSVRTFLQESGFHLQSCFAMGSSSKSIAGAGEADVNLVVSSAGLEAAQVLQKRFGIPYVVGLPTGQFAENVADAMYESILTGNSTIVYQTTEGKTDSSPIKAFLPDLLDQTIYLIGEAVIAQSIREAVFLEYGLKIRVLCYLETPEALLDERSTYLSSEEELKEKLEDADIVIADPMYQPICPQKARLIPLPQESFSGRIWRKYIPDLTKPKDILYNRLN